MPSGWSAVSRSAPAGKSCDPAQRAGGDRVGVEHDEVGGEALATHAAVGEPEQVGLHLGQLVHGLLHGEHALARAPSWPSRSVASGASHSWPTWAPASDRPSVQPSSSGAACARRPRRRWPARPGPGCLERRLGEREVEQQVERVDAALGGDVEQPAADQLRVGRRLHHLVRLPARRQPPWARRPTRRAPAGATPGRRRRRGRSSSVPAISSANTGLVFSVNGSTMFIENVSGRRRHLRATPRRPCCMPCAVHGRAP